MTTVYLAGPDVFHPNANAILENKTALIKALGFKVLTPFDGDSTDSREIFNANALHCQNADIVLADLSRFRGTEPDSGTVWEVGAAHTGGATVLAYNVSRLDYRSQVQSSYHGGWCSDTDRQGKIIENFGLRLNLMLAHSVDGIFDSWTEMLTYLKDHYKRGTLHG